MPDRRIERIRISSPPAEYVFIDCTKNEDFTVSFLSEPDRSHQYYRESLTVSADIARVLKGLDPPDGARAYDPKGNVYSLPTIAAGV
jgi:hypothetical protein